jgi:hypothetical protein
LSVLHEELHIAKPVVGNGEAENLGIPREYGGASVAVVVGEQWLVNALKRL